jgi:hypothetical protein
MKEIVKRLGGEFKLIKYSENIKVKPVVHRRCGKMRRSVHERLSKYRLEERLSKFILK